MTDPEAVTSPLQRTGAPSLAMAAPRPTAAPEHARLVRRLQGLVVAAWVLYLGPAVLATAAFVAALVTVFPRGVFLYLFIGFGLYGYWTRLLSSIRLGAKGITEEEAERRYLAASNGSFGAYDATDDLDSYARLTDQGSFRDAEAELPALVRVVHAAADRLGVARPETIALTRGAWSVLVSPGARTVSVGTSFLTIASLAELEAELARHLAPQGAPAELRALRWARTITTGVRWDPPGFTSRLNLVLWPAQQVVDLVAATAMELAERVRADAFVAATAASGVDAAWTGAVRSTVAPVVWRAHVSALQRQWTAEGDAVAPHERWPAAWEAARDGGRPVVIDAADLLDPCVLQGWTEPAPPPMALPEVAAVSALDELAGPERAAVLRGLDDTAAAQYFQAHVNVPFGALGGAPLNDDESAEPWRGAALPLQPDPADPMPYTAMILAQLNVLSDGVVRRDAAALAAAQQIGAVAEAPAVLAMAAGVRWLCGDPNGVDAIRRALVDASRGAGTLADLVPALRAAGEDALADEVVRAVDAVGQGIRAPYNLRKVLSRANELERPDAPPSVRSALSEIAASYPGTNRVWFAEVDGTGASIRPALIIVKTRFLSTGFGPRRETRINESFDTLNAVWPVTRLEWTNYVGFDGRRRLRKAFVPL